MPELPEVTTTVNGLQKVLPRLTILDVWTDLAKKDQKIKHFKETIKDLKFYTKFRKEIKGKKVINVERRAKNILINLTGDNTILIHLKMTGHLLYGEYLKKGSKWEAKHDGPLKDPYNRFIHVVFSLSNGKHLAFSDSRKFGKVTILKTKKNNFEEIGPEPLDLSFTLSKFKKQILTKPNWKIKTTLMSQSVIAGIGNIYSDEMLWLSNIHPESLPSKIPNVLISKLYNEMKKVLIKGIDFGGDSMSDYRNIDGLKGDFQHHHNVYKKKGTKCLKKGCNGDIIRKVVNGRSAHFCNVHQKLFT